MAKEPENKPTTPTQKLLMVFITLIFLLLLVSLSVSSPAPMNESGTEESFTRQGCLEAGGVWDVAEETCAGAERESTDAVGWPESVDIAVGQTSDVGGLSITLDEIVSDDRCREDAFCLTDGGVTVAATFLANDSEQSVNLNLAGSTFEFNSYLITIASVAPAAGADISEDDYEVTFQVDRVE